MQNLQAKSQNDWICAVDSCQKKEKRWYELHVCKVTIIFIIYLLTSKVIADEGFSFLKFIKLIHSIGWAVKSVLWRPPHPPKVET